jgi:hypothetical protein
MSWHVGLLRSYGDRENILAQYLQIIRTKFLLNYYHKAIISVDHDNSTRMYA